MSIPPHPLWVQLMDRPVEELQMLCRKIAGVNAQTRRRRYLVGVVMRALAARAVGPPAPPPDDRPLTDLSVRELRERYIEVIGRPTKSSRKKHLRERIRDALHGRIPVGPRTLCSVVTPAVETWMFNVRFRPDLVRRMDEAWKRLGLRNRMDLFRRALHSYFAAHGEHEVAAEFARWIDAIELPPLESVLAEIGVGVADDRKR